MSERETIARNLKIMRTAGGYTQDEVAGYLGVGRSAYSNYEAGDREVPLEYIEKVADLYGCDGYLVYEESQDIVKSMVIATAFRVDRLSPEDMRQIAAFKAVVKNSLMLDELMSR